MAPAMFTLKTKPISPIITRFAGRSGLRFGNV